MHTRRHRSGLAGLLFLVFSLAGSTCYGQGSGALSYTVTSSSHCSLEIQQQVVSGNTLSLVYKTLPANQAGANHNSLWLWRATAVPWQYPPMKRVVLPAGATESGSYALDAIDIAIGTGYVACYSLDSGARQICACAHLAAGSDSTAADWVDIGLVNVATNSLTLTYRTLEGYLPATYGNWFGIWAGEASPFNPFPALGIGKPAGDASMGTGTINNIQLERGQTYTLIYFTGTQPTHAAAMIIFTIQ